jgi:hypothetical protein
VSSNQSLVMHLNMNDKGAEDLFGYIEDESGELSWVCFLQRSTILLMSNS